MRDPDAVLARLDRETAEALRRADDARAFRRSLDAVRGRGEVHGVTATVDATGLLVDLELPDQLGRRRGSEVAADVLGAVRAAQAAAARDVQARTDQTFGGGSPIATRMRGELVGRFGEFADSDQD